MNSRKKTKSKGISLDPPWDLPSTLWVIGIILIIGTIIGVSVPYVLGAITAPVVP